MRKIILVLAMALIMSVVLGAEKVATLVELVKPESIAIGNGRLYVNERANIFMYSMKDLKFLGKFGKEGEGPKEFKIVSPGPPFVFIPYKNRLYINSMAKLSVFTEGGKFIKENRIPANFIFSPLDDKYLVLGSAPDKDEQPKMASFIYNEKMERIKTLYFSDMEVGMNMSFSFPFAEFSSIPFKSKIFQVRGKEGFVIEVFDNNGKTLYTIKRKERTLPLSDEYKQKTIKALKMSPLFKEYWDYFKDRILFKSHFPIIQAMDVNQDRVYVVTYQKDKAGNYECIIMNLKGKEIKRVFIDYPSPYGFEFKFPLSFHNHGFYTLVENEDDDVWELHRQDIR